MIDENISSLIVGSLPLVVNRYIILSAGFDAHTADPLANLNLIEKDFEAITMKLKLLANQYCGGKIVSMLEGGYDIHALEQSMITHLKVLQNND